MHVVFKQQVSTLCFYRSAEQRMIIQSYFDCPVIPVKSKKKRKLKITSGYLCVNCDEIPDFIHKMIFRGNNQNIVYWKLHAFSYPTFLKQTVQKKLIPIGYSILLGSFRINIHWSLSTIKYNPARFVFN